MKQRIFFAVDFSLMCSRPICVLLCHLITRIGYKVKILKMFYYVLMAVDMHKHL